MSPSTTRRFSFQSTQCGTAMYERYVIVLWVWNSLCGDEPLLRDIYVIHIK